MRALHAPKFIAGLAETWFRRPRSPNRLVVQITRRCNLRCSMCWTWKAETGHEMTVEEIGRLAAELPKLSWLDVTGGEPFLRRDAEEALLAFATRAPALTVLHFPTNGWFEERVVRAVRAIREQRPELDVIVTVSIDGPREVHDAIRGVPGSFDRAIRTFERLHAIEGVDTYVGTTLSEANRGHLEELAAVLHQRIPSFAASQWHWNWMQISDHFFKNGALAGKEPAAAPGLVRAHVQRRGLPRDLVDVMELVFLANLEFHRRGEPTGIPCQALRSTCFVSPEGDVYPCHVWDRPLGNVRERSFADIWSAPKTLDTRREVERLACGGCFTPCEAYPALAGAPVATVRKTATRALRLLRESVMEGAKLEAK